MLNMDKKIEECLKSVTALIWGTSMEEFDLMADYGITDDDYLERNEIAMDIQDITFALFVLEAEGR